MPWFTAPGRLISWATTTGRVGLCGRARNEVAPNSPRLVARAKPAAKPPLRHSTGPSTLWITRPGPAPREAAASRWRGSIPRSAGTKVRTTSGTATTAWASGTIHQDLVKASGGRARVIRKPKPTVTALTPSGSMKNPSSHTRPRLAQVERGWRETTTAIHTPDTRAIAPAVRAVRSENQAACSTLTSKAGVACGLNRSR